MRGVAAVLAGLAVVLTLPPGLGALTPERVPSPPLEAWGPGRVLASDTVPTLDEIRRLLGPGGDRGAGLAALGAYPLDLPPARATLWIQLLAAVERTDPGLAPLLLESVELAEAGDGLRGADRLESAVAGTGEEDRSALLWLAALISQAPDPVRSAHLRERLLAQHPDAPEAPEAAYRHARWLLGPGGDRERALALLEELVVSRPGHPVAPTARALLMEARRP
jgi:hypothetical protein